MSEFTLEQKMTTWRTIDQILEELCPESREAGQALYKAGFKNTQIRGFETLVVSTRRFTEIINYIKNQAGKKSANAQQWRSCAPALLKQLDTLEQHAGELGQGDPAMTLDSKLRLARGWARQVVTSFLFENARVEIAGGRHG